MIERIHKNFLIGSEVNLVMNAAENKQTNNIDLLIASWKDLLQGFLSYSISPSYIAPNTQSAQQIFILKPMCDQNYDIGNIQRPHPVSSDMLIGTNADSL